MKNKLKTICIIPARGGSKELPGKNLRIFNGKPLIAWRIIAATNCKKIDNVIVTTDSEEIDIQTKLYGAQVPFLRPPNLAQDNTTTEAASRDALDKFEKLTRQHFDICVFLTCTDIFRDTYWHTNAIEKLENNNPLESVFNAHPTNKNFWQINKDGKLKRVSEKMKVYSNIHDKKPIYREDTGLACASRSYLWHSGKRIGNKVETIINNNFETSIDIHNEFDFFLAEKALEYLKKNNPEKVKLFL